MVLTSTEAAEITQVRDLLGSLLRIETYRELQLEFTKNPKLLTLFELTGKVTRDEIQKRLHLSPTIIAETWASWENRDLLRKVGKSIRKHGWSRWSTKSACFRSWMRLTGTS